MLYVRRLPVRAGGSSSSLGSGDAAPLRSRLRSGEASGDSSREHGSSVGDAAGSSEGGVALGSGSSAFFFIIEKLNRPFFCVAGFRRDIFGFSAGAAFGSSSSFGSAAGAGASSFGSAAGAFFTVRLRPGFF